MNKIPISELIPQQPPFVFVDELTSTDELRSVSTYAITEATLLVENGALTTGGLMENIAQTSAARIGYSSKMGGEAVRVGVIGAVKKLNIVRHPKIGEHLRTEVVETTKFQDMTLLDATIFVEDEVVASAQINVTLI